MPSREFTEPVSQSHAELRRRHGFLAKDFVETRDGLFCAVVVPGLECERVLVTPRYRQAADRGLCKLTSLEAQALVRDIFPQWLFHSPSRDVWLPAIPTAAIARAYQPTSELRAMIATKLPQHSKIAAAAAILAPILVNLGITGSHLVGAATAESDIDLVVYGRRNFARAQQLLKKATHTGALAELSESQWQTTYERRGCDDLTLEQYRWHERRKLNKFSIDGTKIDLSCIDQPHAAACRPGHKLRFEQIQARVTDDRFAFDSPAVYGVAHARIPSIVVFTATYTGQTVVGEQVEAAGQVEQDCEGNLRLVIGSSRESQGEFLRVI